jgi:hypothetical protein
MEGEASLQPLSLVLHFRYLRSFWRSLHLIKTM